MPTTIYTEDYWKAEKVINECGVASLRQQIAQAIATERERCATLALEQRCERGTPWDRACVTIADKIRNTA